MAANIPLAPPPITATDFLLEDCKLCLVFAVISVVGELGTAAADAANDDKDDEYFDSFDCGCDCDVRTFNRNITGSFKLHLRKCSKERNDIPFLEYIFNGKPYTIVVVANDETTTIPESEKI